MRIAPAIAQSEFSRLESSAAGATNAQAEFASLRNQSTEEISVTRQKLGYAEQHAMNSEQQIHLMQQEVIAHNSEHARIAEQSRQAEAAARQANDLQEDKIKILSNQMQELIAWTMRLDIVLDLNLRARTELSVRPVHIGTPPRLDFQTPVERVLPATDLSCHPFLRKEWSRLHQATSTPIKMGDLQVESHRKGQMTMMAMMTMFPTTIIVAAKMIRKKSRGRRRRRSPSSSPSSSSSSRRSSSSSSSGGKLDKKAVKKLIKAITGAASSSKDEHDSDKPRVKEAEKNRAPCVP